MSLVPIDDFKELLTGNIWDKFKELIEPYALINAIIFIVLNIVLVYPTLADLAKNTFIDTLSQASDAWKITVATVSIFVISYLLNHLSMFSLNFASGEIFRGSQIGILLKNLQKNQFNKLKKESGQMTEQTNNEEIEEIINETTYEITQDDTSNHTTEKMELDRAAFRLAYEFPVYEAELGLTKLGNLLLNPASYVAYQYGISMQLAWPFIQEKLSDDNKTLKSIQANWLSLLFFASLNMVLVFVATELVLVITFGEIKIQIWQLWQSIILLLVLAGLAYYVSLEKTRQWGKGMRRIFDTHVRDIFVELGMDALKDLTPASADFKTRWQEVMGWLAYGAIKEFEYTPQEAWYTTTPPDVWPKLKHPNFLYVDGISQFSQEMFCKKEDQIYTCIEQSIDYSFAITNISTGKHPVLSTDAYLFIQDDRIMTPPTVPGYLSKLSAGNNTLAFDKIMVTGQQQPGNPNGLLFPLGNLVPGASRILTYSVERQIARVTANNIGIKNIEFKKSLKEKAVEALIDIFIEDVTENTIMQLKIEVLGDAQIKVKEYAKIFFMPPKSKKNDPIKRNVSTDNHSHTWNLNLEPGKIHKIEITLEG